MPSAGSRARQCSKTMDSEWRLDELLSGRRPDKVPVFLNRAIEHMGATRTIAGNVEPAILQNGTRPRMHAAGATAIKEGKRARLGFVLMPGCSTPPYARIDSVRAMVEAATELGGHSQVRMRFGRLKKG